MMHGDWGQMGWGGWIGMTLMLIFWAAIIFVIVTALLPDWHRTRVTPTNAPDRPDQSFVILRERFARGEITSSEFEQAQHILNPDPGQR
jgi:uncharacterized membrane protein